MHNFPNRFAGIPNRFRMIPNRICEIPNRFWSQNAAIRTLSRRWENFSEHCVGGCSDGCFRRCSHRNGGRRRIGAADGTFDRDDWSLEVNKDQSNWILNTHIDIMKA